MTETVTSNVKRKQRKRADTGAPMMFRTSDTEFRLFRELVESRLTTLTAIIAAKVRQSKQKPRQPEKIDGSSLFVSTSFSIRIPPEIRADLEEIAREKGIGKSELIHSWLWEELKRDGIAILTSPTNRSTAKAAKAAKAGKESPKAHARSSDITAIKHRKITK